MTPSPEELLDLPEEKSLEFKRRSAKGIAFDDLSLRQIAEKGPLS